LGLENIVGEYSQKTITQRYELIAALTRKFGEGRRVSSTKEEWEFQCPLCKHPSHLHISLSNGFFVCVTPGCLYKGHISSLLRVKTEIKVPEPVPLDYERLTNVYTQVISLGTLRASHRRWLEKRGICPTITPFISSDSLVGKVNKLPKEDLEYAGLTSESGLLSAILGMNRVILPYIQRDTGKVEYIRGRTLNLEEKPKYLSPRGISALSFTYGWHLVDISKDYMVITEGEFKALAALQLGINCVGLPGMSISHKKAAEMCKQFGFKTVYVLFDSEVDVVNGIPKQEIVDTAANKLANCLKQQGISVYIAKLPTTNGVSEKIDIDTFILQKGADAKSELLVTLQMAKQVK